MLVLFSPPAKKVNFFVIDTVRTNQMPNLVNLYNDERTKKLSQVIPLFIPRLISIVLIYVYKLQL